LPMSVRVFAKALASDEAHEYQPEISPPSAHDSRNRPHDGPAMGFRSSLSSSWRDHLRRTRSSLVVLALLALVIAPGTRFAVATGPDSDLAPVRGLRRLAQTTSGGGVEYRQRAKLTADDGAADDQFGWSVSIDGDTMVIGGHGDDDRGSNGGSAYVFRRDVTGDRASGWTQVAKLSADDTAAGDEFGYSVSIDGDTVVIGAYGDDDNGSVSGSAYVFRRSTVNDRASGWTQVAKLTAADGAEGDRFGVSVAIDGDTVVIGAHLDDDDAMGSNSGSAYVFRRITAGDITSDWTQVAKLIADDGAAEYWFGISVAINGDTVVIGARNEDNTGVNSGSAYVFTRDTGGDLASGWTQVAKLTADDGAGGDDFGYSVAINGDTVVIGAYGDDDKGIDSGSAYVFRRNTAGDLTSGWTQVAKLTANDGAASDYFGRSVSIDGDALVVGAYADDDKGSNSGAGYVFERNTAGDLTSNWTQVAKLTADDGAAASNLGISVSMDGNAVAIGAWGQDGKGTAYVFFAPPPSLCDASTPPANGAVGNCTDQLSSGTTCQPTCDEHYAVSGPSVCEDGVLSPAVCARYPQRTELTANNGAAADYFGFRVSVHGDTMVIGSYGDDDKGSGSGSAYVFTRDTAGAITSGWTQVATLTADDGAADDYFGYSVSVNGETMVIGAYGDDDNGSNSGSAYVFTRDTNGDITSGWTQVAKLTANDGAAGDYFGSSVAIDGNTVVIGAYGDDGTGGNSGSAYVFRRITAGDITSGWAQVAQLTADDSAVEDNFGFSVAIDGDTMVIGAIGDDDNGGNSGSAYVFTRDTGGDLASGWTQIAKLTADDGAGGDYFGHSVSINGNTMVIGSQLDDDKGIDSGSAYVFRRAIDDDLSSNWTQVAKLTANDGAAGDYFGIAVSIDGDTVVVGANMDDDKGSNSGSAYVFERNTAGDLSSNWTQVAKLTGNDGKPNDYFGRSVSVDGNTVAIGAWAHDSKGSAYVFFAAPPSLCDASTPPTNGAVGNCTDQLLNGTTCQPTCDEHYTVSGVSKCVGRTLIPAQCLGPCDMDSCCYFYNKRRGFNVDTCAPIFEARRK